MPELISALSWWQWVILAAVPPAIVALYFLKLKRRPVEVPSTYLWHKSIEDLHVNTIWQRLRNNLLLYLQLAVVALVMLAVLQPGWRSHKAPGKHAIFLIDNSASMQATDLEPSRLAEAKRQALEEIEQMAAGDVGMVIAFSDTADVKQSFTDNLRDLRRAVESIQPTGRATSLFEALKVASGLANPGTSGDIDTSIPATLFIFSDGRFEKVSGFTLGNLEPVYRPIGTAAPANVGIVAMSVRRHETRPAELQAFARLQNFGPDEASVSVDLALDGRQIDSSRFTVSAGQTHGVVFNLGALESGVLHLKASTGDHLALDDEAWIAVNKPRRARVLVATPGNPDLERALGTAPVQEIADVAIVPPAFLEAEEYRRKAGAGQYDLVIYDRCVPTESPQANTFFIGRLPPGDAWKAEPKRSLPQIIDVDPSHPLMEWLDLGDVDVAEATPLRAPPGGRVLVDSNRGPLLALAPREGFEDLVLGFVLVDQSAEGGKAYGTNWIVRRSFPTFVLNLCNYLGRGISTLSADTLRPGQQVFLDCSTPTRTLRVRTPSGQEIGLAEVQSGKYQFSRTNELGVYDVRSGDEVIQHFAVNLFQPSESDLRVEPRVEIGQVAVAGQAAPETTRREIWKLLLTGGLAVLLLEWYIYTRRISM
ncbi:MAG: BatA and WFA domain-containing protein [Thermoguttaceae bacterium]|jgi:hypothetical protein|nr:BatA and WFA domain-containing protein [Thermoguttaceae bacterium]